MRKEQERASRGGRSMEGTTGARQRVSGGMQMETTLTGLQPSLCLGTDNGKASIFPAHTSPEFSACICHTGRVRF